MLNNKLHLARKYALGYCSRTLSVPRSKTFSEKEDPTDVFIILQISFAHTRDLKIAGKTTQIFPCLTEVYSADESVQSENI